MLRLRKGAYEAVAVDIAPLVDVVFQLLLFFMLTSSFVLHPGVHVTLPKATTSQNLSASGITITLTKDHLVHWNDEVVTLDELQQRLEKAGHSEGVLIRSDQHAYVERLIQLWDLCRAAGYTKIRIATLPSE